MSKILLPQWNRSFVADENKTLLENLQDQAIPVGSSCGGVGICGKCVLKIENCKQPMTSEEQEYFAVNHQPSPQHRLSCQITACKDDLTVQAPYW